MCLSCVLLVEFALVHQAFYTATYDQSAWLYHRWLLGRVLLIGRGHILPSLLIALGQIEEQTAFPTSPPAPSLSAYPATVFSSELSFCRNLDEVEPNCKWVLLT